jgi:hypothetical protein
MPTTEETGTCHGCGKELRGAVEVTLVARGPLVRVALRETPDCNWTKCGGCGKAVCKSCDRFLRLLSGDRVRSVRVVRIRTHGRIGVGPFETAHRNGSPPHAQATDLTSRHNSNSSKEGEEQQHDS